MATAMLRVAQIGLLRCGRVQVVHKRLYATEPFKLSKEASEALRNATKQSSRPRMPGPFPDSPSPQSFTNEDLLSFRELSLPRKFKRAGRHLTSITVVLFGVVLTAGIVWTFSTELFATASPTRVMNQAVPLLRANDELNSILRQPLTFHGEGGGRRARRIHSHIQRNALTGRDEKIIRFTVEGSAKEDPSESYWHRIKRFIRPVVVEPLNHPLPEPIQAPAPPPKQESTSWFALSNWIGALMPSTRTGRPPSLLPSRSKPAFGSLDVGDVTAVLVQISDGTFHLKSIQVDFRDPVSNRHLWTVPVLHLTDAQVEEAAHRSTWESVQRWVGNLWPTPTS